MASVSYTIRTRTLLDNITVAAQTDSDALDVRKLIAAALSIEFGAGLSATFKVLGSIDGTVFADMGISITAATGSADSRVINLYGLGVNYIKVRISPTSGSAAVTVKGSAKGA